jgi:hypothetical protein
MKSFLQGKKIAQVEPLRLPPQPGAPAGLRGEASRPHSHAAGVATPGASSAQVEVVKEGDKVVRLIVHCVCGERVEIDCLYSAGR